MNKEFSAETRQKNIKNLSDQVFDLLIIGGGINGAGIARDAASRGLTVALVEMNDFASGTSSRSSKLIHGGLRYLENLDFHLVFEALSERAKLFEIAPHLVHPLRFLVPLYKTGRVGPFKMGLGMWLYDVLALFDTPKMHCYYSSQEAIQRVPVLKPTLLNGAFEYSDAYMDDDRLVIETLRSANEAGAVAVNYVSAKQPLVNDQGELTGFECVDLMSDSKFNVKARHIVSTVGPWTDQIGNKVYSDWKPIMRPSKGVHLTFSKEDFQIPCAVVMAAEQRIVFAIPRNEMVIVGTTDTDFKEDPSSIKTERKDVEYLLNVINDYFPGVQVTEEKIISSYSGVRPLVDDGAASEGKTSREHTIKTDKKRHFTYVAGGKYTTYRLIAEQAVDSILEDFSFEFRSKLTVSETIVPLNPLATKEGIFEMYRRAESLAQEYGFSKSAIERFIQRHGAEALVLLKISQNIKEENEDLRVWLCELEHALNTTMCMSLKDFYLRRTPLLLSHRDYGLNYFSPLFKHYCEREGSQSLSYEQAFADLKRHIQYEMGWRTKGSVQNL